MTEQQVLLLSGQFSLVFQHQADDLVIYPCFVSTSSLYDHLCLFCRSHFNWHRLASRIRFLPETTECPIESRSLPWFLSISVLRLTVVCLEKPVALSCWGFQDVGTLCLNMTMGECEEERRDTRRRLAQSWEFSTLSRFRNNFPWIYTYAYCWDLISPWDVSK